MILGSLLTAALGFIQSVRYLQHVHYVFLGKTTDALSKQIPSRAMLGWTMGFRTVYFAGSVGLWLLGPTWMVLATVAVLYVMYCSDGVSVIKKESV